MSLASLISCRSRAATAVSPPRPAAEIAALKSAGEACPLPGSPPALRIPSKRASAFSHSPARSMAAMAADQANSFGSTSSVSSIEPSTPMARIQSPPRESAAIKEE